MQTNINNNEKEKNHKLCMYLLFLPVFFFCAYLMMWKRSQNDGYKKMGIFYGVSSLATFVAIALGLIWVQIFVYALITHVIVWMLCTIHTLNCRQQYQQLAQWEAEDKKREALAEDTSFRLRNSAWTIWNYIPLMGGFSTMLLGRMLDNKKLIWAGALSTLAVAAFAFYLVMIGGVTGPVLFAISAVLVYCSLCAHPLLAYFFYEDYMDAAARGFNELIADFPQLEDKKWRFTNSLWQVLTLIPSFGSMGLFWVGITREDKATIWKACGTLLLEMACLAIPTILLGNAALLEAMPIMKGIADGISALGIFVYALVVFTGATIRTEMLCIRAEQEMDF